MRRTIIAACMLLLALALVGAPLSAAPPSGGVPLKARPGCLSIPATIVGTANDDDIRGTSGSDVVVALDGNDTIKALRGNDIVCGGPGDDVIRGDRGRDGLFGDDEFVEGTAGSGRDRVLGGKGDDHLEGGLEQDYVNGGSGTDECSDEGDTIVNCEG